MRPIDERNQVLVGEAGGRHGPTSGPRWWRARPDRSSGAGRASASIGRLPSWRQIRSNSRLHLVSRRMRRPIDADAPRGSRGTPRRRGRCDPASCRELDCAQVTAADVGEAPRASRERGQPLLRRVELAGQVLALGPVELEREGELVPPLPGVFGQERRAGGEVLQRRGVGRRGLGALARDEVELGHPLALRPGDVISAAPRSSWFTISKICSSSSSGGVSAPQQPADAEVQRRPLAVGDERVGRLLHAIVREAVGALEPQEQTSSTRRSREHRAPDRAADDGQERRRRRWRRGRRASLSASCVCDREAAAACRPSGRRRCR